MKKTGEIYEYLDRIIPSSLSCEWDNDGIMCAPDGDRPVSRVLFSLEANARVIEYAAENAYDLIITHHPLIFDPLRSLSYREPLSACIETLIKNNIAVFSFHTRLDALEDGVNGILAGKLSLCEAESCGEVSKIGSLACETTVEEFAASAKASLGCDAVRIVDAGRPVRRVAVCGGSGKGEIDAVINAGADTFLTGETSYAAENDACLRRLNLIECGHFFTENPVCEYLMNIIKALDATLECRIISSNCVKTL